MRIAIVSCGLLDSLLPLVRRLSKHIEIDLYVSVYGTKFNENVASFDLSNQPTGLIDEATSRDIAGERLLSYIEGEGGKIGFRIFKYPDLKILNRKNLQLHREFAKWLNQQNYDAVHLNGYRGALMFLYGLIRRQTPKVWSIHDPILHSGEDKWQTRFAYSSFRFLKAHFILHNQTQCPEFIERYSIEAQKCHYVPLGPLDIFQIFKNGGSERTGRNVLFYGRISPYKGVEYLVEAARIVHQKMDDLKVVIAGKPNYAINLDPLKNEKGFEIKDHFIDNEEIVKMIEASEFVVCPYTDATQSGVVMTAYAFHKPVLATAVGGLEEAVEEGATGRLVPPRDPQALADAMLKMLTEEDALKGMEDTLKSRHQDGPYSWKGIARATLEIYQKAIASY